MVQGAKAKDGEGAVVAPLVLGDELLLALAAVAAIGAVAKGGGGDLGWLEIAPLESPAAAVLLDERCMSLPPACDTTVGIATTLVQETSVSTWD